MQILFDQCVHDLRNVGNNAMLEVAMGRFAELCPDALMGVVTLSPQILRLYYPNVASVNPGISNYGMDDPTQNEKYYRLIPRKLLLVLLELREEAWHRQTKNKQARNDGPAGQTLHLGRMFQELFQGDDQASKPRFENTKVKQYKLNEPDVLVATGGHYLSDVVKAPALQILDRIELASRQGKPIFMTGQGVGPIYDPELRRRAGEVLPKVDYISVREKLFAPEILKSLGVDPGRIFVTGDDAIELAYNSRTTHSGSAIGVNIRIADYTEVEENHIEVIRETIQNAGRKYDARLVAVPISQSRTEADNRAILRLIGGYKNILYSWRKFETPLDIIRRVSLCRLVVTGGYHPAVFALAQGIPVVCLAKSAQYANKFLGLADQFGPGCRVIFLNDEHFRDDLENAISFAWQSAEQLKPHLLESAITQISNGRLAFERVCDLIRSGQQN